jgi:hypothetical protein
MNGRCVTSSSAGTHVVSAFRALCVDFSTTALSSFKRCVHKARNELVVKNGVKMEKIQNVMVDSHAINHAR